MAYAALTEARTRRAAVSLERGEWPAQLRAEWEELAERTGAVPFVRPAWVAAWWRAFGRGRLAVLVLRRGGELTGVVPLALRAGVRAAPANWHTPSFAPLAEDERDHEDLARALFAGRTRRVELRMIPADHPTLAACRAAVRRSGWRLIERTLESSPYLAITGDWERYAATRRPDFLADTRRRRRRLEEHGLVTVEYADGTERLDALLDEGFPVEGSGWKTSQGTAILSRRETESFYREVAHWAAGRGWLRLAFLRVDGRTVAFQYNIVALGVLHHLKGGFDPAYARFSPARLLAFEVIQDAFRQRLERIDYLGQSEEYKLKWASATQDRQLLQAFPRAPAGTVEWAAFAHGRPLARDAREWVRDRQRRRSAAGGSSP
jgi:CelD/BcsL family acetyltransferase involved in cellulose biosynthesis